MRQKFLTKMFCGLLLVVSCSNITYAKDITNSVEIADASSTISQPTNNPIIEVSNKTGPTLVAPIVVDPKLQRRTSTQKTEKSRKLDLRAVVFDPNADFKAQAEEEGREMTGSEQLEYNVHEALHGKVEAVSRKGLLANIWTVKPERGLIQSVTPWYFFRGAPNEVWSGANYANTFYSIASSSLGFDGKLKDNKTAFRVMFNFGQSPEGHTFFQDAMGDNYIMRSITKNDQILVGYSRDAIGVEGANSPFILPFFNLAQITKAYSNCRSLGVKAQGQHKLYDYSAGIFSAGRNFIDYFPGAEFIGSLALKPLGLTDGKYGNLSIGGGLDAGNNMNQYTVGTAFVDYEYKRLNVTAEYGSADGSNGMNGCTTAQSEGFYGTVAYRLTPKTQLLVRYDQFDPNKSKANDIRREYTAGVNYYIKGQALRLTLNYILYSIENGTYGSKIYAGTQIIL